MARQGYAKLSNGLWLNDKVNDLIDANPHAFAIWTLAISYCSDELNDGVLTMRALRRLGAEKADLLDLVEFGLLDELENGRYAIHDYLEHQNSRDEVESARDNARDRKRRQRAKENVTHDDVTPNVTRDNDVTHDDVTPNVTRDNDVTHDDVTPNVTRDNDVTHDDVTPGVTPKFLGLNQNQNQNQEDFSNEKSLPQTPSRGPGETPDEDYPLEFEQFWATYPRHEGKRDAYRAWRKARRKTNNTLLIAKASLYAADPNREPGYTKTPANWLNGECWLDDRLPAKPKPGQPDPEAERAKRLRDVDWLCTHVDDVEAQDAALELGEQQQAMARARYPDAWYRLYRRGQKRRERREREKATT
ncbi:hypothetical protein BISA_0862 [Bifidobacterium saguini DSM 23967]|uniref:Uncharacterized protein n=2 Tax=Bifidobacterium saguini TaxID=762210 RepID=A0A087DAB1_9BIFI|nr:hypothetical protein [Bifidobacterium saguini]KFI92461.1 hypothetical protein BISA_0862 [Bifidobacterium saguini DSM 23967]QTB90813.1 hypothetical protein BSD967_11100 [Bifidobacterium saguini]QTB90875.1 hypothetical protein BSD967_11435 [Bifidobacterium saguini]